MVFTSFSCMQSEQERDENPGKDVPQKLRVLTTIVPLYSFAKNIAGDAAIIENLLPSGADPHEYAISPEDAMKVAGAEVLIKNGINIEDWLTKLIEAAGKSNGHSRQKLHIVDTSKGVKIINNDPHIWLSPRNAITQVKTIRDALIKADTLNSDIYMENAGKYINRLEILDSLIKAEIKKLNKKEFISFHPAFLYFATDYGLDQVAVIQEKPEMQPTPRHIADVMNIIQTKGIKSIFTGPGASHKIVRSIANDMGLKIYELDTMETGTLSEHWYEEKIKANLTAFKDALN